jgi:hypothetical protein
MYRNREPAMDEVNHDGVQKNTMIWKRARGGCAMKVLEENIRGREVKEQTAFDSH